MTAAIVLVGVWVTGGLITDDFQLSAALTTAWFGVAGLAALATARRRPDLRFPVLGGYLVTAVAAAGILAFSTFRDRTVDEDVVTGPALASGRFESLAHDTTGLARVVGRTLTLTGFETDAGPDLRIYLSTPDESAHVDLGALKGNRGDQQYDVPRGTDLDRYSDVLIWCRAFSVGFGRARLDRARARALPSQRRRARSRGRARPPPRSRSAGPAPTPARDA